MTLMAAALLAGCASKPPADPSAAATTADALAALQLSHTQSSIGTQPEGWQTLVIRPDKRKTQYQVASARVGGQPQRVLHAVADSSATGLWVPMSFKPDPAPVIGWSWRTDAMIPNADSTRAETEDSPVRLVLAFDGDWSKLSMRDQRMAETARMLLGRDMPYATLIYTWDTAQPIEAVIPNSHTDRIKKKVVESGPARVGQWISYQRNYVRDYVEAFGEPPGQLIGVGVLTDSDNTKQQAQGWYGDIHLLSDKTVAGELPRPIALER
jgi:hypothetical protein